MEREIIDRFDKTTTEILGRLEHLEMMVKELDQRTSVPAGKSLTKSNRANKKIQEIEEYFKSVNYDTPWPSSQLKDEKPNLEHYYYDGMPRLDKYLAYIKIDYSDKGAKNIQLFLLDTNCNVSIITDRLNENEKTYIKISGLVDINNFQRRSLIILANRDGGDALSHITRTVFNQLCNNKCLNIKDIYGDIKNHFRTIEIDVGVYSTTMSITNTIYSSYGCMEEVEPIWEDTINTCIDIDLN